jgi:hypothetical protein
MDRFFSFGLHSEYTLAVGTYDGCTFWGNHLKVRLNWLLQWYTSLNYDFKHEHIQNGFNVTAPVAPKGVGPVTWSTGCYT